MNKIFSVLANPAFYKSLGVLAKTASKTVGEIWHGYTGRS